MRQTFINLYYVLIHHHIIPLGATPKRPLFQLPHLPHRSTRYFTEGNKLVHDNCKYKNVGVVNRHCFQITSKYQW